MPWALKRKKVLATIGVNESRAAVKVQWMKTNADGQTGQVAAIISKNQL